MSLFKLLVILMLTNLKYILAYNMKQHKHCCSERCSPKSWPPKEDNRDRLCPRNLTIETEESKTREREAMRRFSSIALRSIKKLVVSNEMWPADTQLGRALGTTVLVGGRNSSPSLVPGSELRSY